METLEADVKILLADKRSIRVWRPFSRSKHIVRTLHEMQGYENYNIKMIDDKICIFEGSEEPNRDKRITIYSNDYTLLHQFTLEDIDVYYEDPENICYVKAAKLFFNGKGMPDIVISSFENTQIELTDKYIIIYSDVKCHIIDKSTGKLVLDRTLVKCLLGKNKLVAYDAFNNKIELIDLDSLSVRTVVLPRRGQRIRIGEQEHEILGNRDIIRLGHTGESHFIGRSHQHFDVEPPRPDAIFNDMSIPGRMDVGISSIERKKEKENENQVLDRFAQNFRLNFKFTMNLTMSKFTRKDRQFRCIIADYFIFYHGDRLFRVNINTGEIIKTEESPSINTISCNDNSAFASFGYNSYLLQIRDLDLNIVKHINPSIRCDNVLLTNDSKVIITEGKKVKIFDILGKALLENTFIADSLYLVPSTKKEKKEINDIITKKVNKYLNKNLIDIVTRFIV